ncbi:MAG: hypothetical protein ACRDD1_09210 [Planctomycetia bacterium]
MHHQPAPTVVRMYLDQTPPNDLGKAYAKRKGITLSPTVTEALGGSTLDMDGVLLIA